MRVRIRGVTMLRQDEGEENDYCNVREMIRAVTM